MIIIVITDIVIIVLIITVPILLFFLYKNFSKFFCQIPVVSSICALTESCDNSKEDGTPCHKNCACKSNYCEGNKINRKMIAKFAWEIVKILLFFLSSI